MRTALRFAALSTLSAIALSFGGCANDNLIQPPMQLGAPAAQAADQRDLLQPRGTIVEPAKPFRRTLSDKMLAASALERATGRKPDPSRFLDIN